MRAEPVIPLPTEISPPERGVIERAQHGDAAAFAQLYAAHRAFVYGICRRFAGDDAEMAQQMAQDVFVRLWETLGQYSARGPFAAWVRRVATNHAINALRTRQRRLRRELLSDGDEESWPAPSHSIETRLDLERAVASLPAGARSVFLLHDVHGYSDEEIANMMEVARGTVRSQLHRARRLLREALAP